MATSFIKLPIIFLIANIVFGLVIKIIRFKTRFAGKFKGFKSSKAMPCVMLKPVFIKIVNSYDTFLEHLIQNNTSIIDSRSKLRGIKPSFYS